ncbi:hypothetical protein BGX21_005143 [Mortierella sp. AD011]|nr:hypothetical protein BGX20_004033 [Mortierella sp. AD010]KAF9400035.1 hypothetical protein BGX21_005143 [Mortierella sp. AD011]
MPVAAEPLASLPDTDTPTIWYLAYGSNMNPKVFTGRRKIQPIESKNVIVPDYWLSFDIGGIPYIEPCFASILKINHARLHDYNYALEVHDKTRFGQEFNWDETHPEHPMRSYPPILQGVAHKITLREWQLVIQSEGGWGHDVPTGYNQIKVSCTVAGTKETISAHVLEARPLSVKSQCQPSLRYKNLLTEGAAHHNIDLAYQQYLARIVPYECVGFAPKAGRALTIFFSSPMLVFFLLVVTRNMGRSADRQIAPPFWAAWCSDKFSRFSGTIHDYFTSQIFGSGRHSSPAHRLLVRHRIEQELQTDKTLEQHQKCMEAEVEREGAALKMAEKAAETMAE